MKIESTTEASSTDSGSLIVYGGMGIQKGIYMGSVDTTITTGTIQINGGGGILLNTFGETGTLLNCYEKGIQDIIIAGGGAGDTIKMNYIKIGNRTDSSNDTFKILHFDSSTITIGAGGSTLSGTLTNTVIAVGNIRGTFLYDFGVTPTTYMGMIIISGTTMTLSGDINGSVFPAGSITIHPFSISYR
jgi:hypothetical protein